MMIMLKAQSNFSMLQTPKNSIQFNIIYIFFHIILEDHHVSLLLYVWRGAAEKKMKEMMDISA